MKCAPCVFFWRPRLQLRAGCWLPDLVFCAARGLEPRQSRAKSENTDPTASEAALQTRRPNDNLVLLYRGVILEAHMINYTERPGSKYDEDITSGYE